MSARRLVLPCVLSLFITSVLHADEPTPPESKAEGGGNSLAYLDECNPWYPHKDFPKLITPQWVGEEGVEAVIVLAIDDMRDPAKYEQYLRPILNRLKQIDGRAPVSIMTNEVKPDDPQLQSWLGEGLSIECHTIDHPCPILQGGDFAKAKSTYDRCVDLMGTIPGNKPVAFRTPCCDSLNTVSPRFFSEIFSKTTETGNFLQIDSSVFTFFTSEDETLPKELVLDASGKERFWKYLPKNNKYGGNTHDNFVNYIKNYPYPYVINNSCWEIPCLAPSDWSAQHLHGINNPVTVEDWKAAIDLTVHKQGCFSLVFHPHGWIKPEQVVEMIDHAVAKHGNKVKFMNFKEVAERLNQKFFYSTKAMPFAYTVRSMMSEGIRFYDVDSNGCLDVVYGGDGAKVFAGKLLDTYDSASMSWQNNEWVMGPFPFSIYNLNRMKNGVHPFRSLPDGKMAFYSEPGGQWSGSGGSGFGGGGFGGGGFGGGGFGGGGFGGGGFGGQLGFGGIGGGFGGGAGEGKKLQAGGKRNQGDIWKFGTQHPSPLCISTNKLQSDTKNDSDSISLKLFVDMNGDGISEAIGLSRNSLAESSPIVFQQSGIDGDGKLEWTKTSLHLPLNHSLDDLCFPDIDGNGFLDPCFIRSNEIVVCLTQSLGRELSKPFSFPTPMPGIFQSPETPIFDSLGFIAPDQRGTRNGFFIHDNHFCWINEDTAKLPDLMYRVSFDEVLKASGRASALRDNAPAAPPKQDGDSAAEPRHNADQKSQISNFKSEVKTAPYNPVPIGAAVVDITPDYPVRLTGYGNRMKESEGVAVRIHARALVIGKPNVAVSLRRDEREGAPQDVGTPAGQSKTAPNDAAALADESARTALISAERDGYTVLITVDNCGVPLEMTEAVYDRIAAKYNIPRQNFAISSSHTHSGPWLRGFAPNIFAEIPDDHAAHLAQYEKDLTDKLVDVVEKAIASQRPGHLSYGFGEAGFAMNRRALADGKWSGFGEVPDGPTDKRVPVLAAHDVDGKLIAVLANYACHCTTETGEFNQISGDWAGFAADMLETDHAGAVALIAIGCGADANPSPRGTHEQAKVHGRTLADEITRILASGRASAFRDRAQLSPLPRAGGEGQGEGAASNDLAASSASSPLIRPSAAVGNSTSRRTDDSSPDLGGEGTMRSINPDILCNMARLDLPLGPLPTREEWEQQAKSAGVEGSRARYFLQMLDEGKPIPTTIPNYPVQTWCFGDDLAMVFLGGEVVVDYSIRMNDMFASDRLWINAYSNDVPCYIASARVLREGGYECDSSMLYYRRPTRLAPEAEDVLCDAVQKIMPHKFYSEKLQQDFPAPKSPEESLKCMTTKPDLRVVLAASEPLIRDPVAFDWDERGRLWVVEMGDYPNGDSSASGRASALRVDAPDAAQTDEEQNEHGGLTPNRSPEYAGRVQMLEDTDKNGVYDKATTFLDNLAFPNGIHCWRGGVIITMAPEIFYAEDTDGDGKADVRETMYRGFVEGNQQHRVNGLRWGLDGWLYLANGDSGGEIAGTGYVPGQNLSPLPRAGGEGQGEGAAANDQAASSASNPLIRPSATFSPGLGGEGTRLQRSVNLRGRDLRINPDTNELDAVSGQTQFGRERDDFGNWFGNNNSNPIWQYVLEDRYVRRNPHAGISQVTAPVAVVPGAAPVYPTSRTLARFNDFAFANRFTSACSTMIYRDNYLGEQYYGNAFTSEPVHNLVSRLVLTRDGYGFKGERAPDEQQSEFLASSDNWFRPTMIRTGPDGAIWVADMYRAVIEHPEWIPPEYQRKMNLYAGSDMGRIYRIVPASECCGEAYGDSAAEQRQPVAPGVSPGNAAPINDKAPEGRQNSHGHKESVALSRLEDPSATNTPGSRPGLQTVVAPRLNADQSNVAVSLRRDEPSPAPQTSGTPTAPVNDNATDNAASADHAKTARLISAERDGYFEQPWNEIPIEALVKRLESPNGWWRDTSQRILVHRANESKVGKLLVDNLKHDLIHPTSQIKVQVAATYQAIIETEIRERHTIPMAAILDLAFRPLLQDADPRVRQAAFSLQLISTEMMTVGNEEDVLNQVRSDSDAGVKLALCLSLRSWRPKGGDRVLGRLLRDNFDDPYIRNAALSSLYSTPPGFSTTNLDGVIAEAIDVSRGPINEELVAILLEQAAALGRPEAITEPLKTLLKSIDSSAPTGRLELIGNLLERTLRGPTLDALKKTPNFDQALQAVREAAEQIARDEASDSDRRAAALRLAMKSGQLMGAQPIELSEFLTPQTPLTLQLAVAELIAANGDPRGLDQLSSQWKSLAPNVRAVAVAKLMQRESSIEWILERMEANDFSSVDLDPVQRDQLIHHRNEQIASRAKKLFDVTANTARSAVVDDFKSQISNLKSEISKDEQAAAGKLVFEKRCATCHRLQDIGKEVGADLAALKDRSTEALLTAILDPNKAVESKFLVYTVVTKDGLQHSGMLKGETGGSLTLIGSDGKEITVSRAEIDELIGTQRSLMPEGLEKDLSAVDLANVLAFVQSTGTLWKRFDGNLPQVVKPNEDGTITLPASVAEIYGPNLVFEPKYGNLGFWTSTEDYAKWTFDVPVSGHWTVELDFACDDATAGSLMKFSTGNRMLTARVPGSGTWDNYQTYRAGTIDIHRGRGQLIVTAPEAPPFALIDLKAVRLIPPGKP